MLKYFSTTPSLYKNFGLKTPKTTGNTKRDLTMFKISISKDPNPMKARKQNCFKFLLKIGIIAIGHEALFPQAPPQIKNPLQKNNNFFSGG